MSLRIKYHPTGNCPPSGLPVRPELKGAQPTRPFDARTPRRHTQYIVCRQRACKLDIHARERRQCPDVIAVDVALAGVYGVGSLHKLKVSIWTSNAAPVDMPIGQFVIRVKNRLHRAPPY